jgi:hypothetical protein
MKLETLLVTILIPIPLLATTAMAQAPSEAPAEPIPAVQASALHKENSLNLSPLGILSGSYGLNYERVFGGYHGLLVEGNFARSSDDDASSSSIGGTLGYRLHWRGKQDSGFVGLNLGYYSGSGEGSVSDGAMTKTFDVDTTVSSITANIGRRWAWNSGLNVTLRIGAGKGNYDVTTDSEDPDAQDVVKAVDDLLAFLPVAFDGELSVGYIF